jgi:hypothetical protein
VRAGRAAPLVAAAAALLALPGCVRTYDLTVDNRTMTSLTLRVYSPRGDGGFEQIPDRIFTLPPNREFRLERAITRTGGDRRLFEFRGNDDQLVDSFVVTYEELDRTAGRITVPRALSAIPRDAPPEPGFVDSSAYEHVEFIPLFPEERGDSAAAP